eukprot:COSAG01_NODE_4328_length_5129_cov_15.312724_3_plen_337_part_00
MLEAARRPRPRAKEDRSLSHPAIKQQVASPARPPRTAEHTHITTVMASAYERKRLANIEMNNRKLAQLGLLPGIGANGLLPGGGDGAARSAAAKQPRKPSTRKRRCRAAVAAMPRRRSARARRQPPEVYSVGAEDDRATQEAQRQISSGHRSADDGRWRGENFGSVPGVPVGTVFGAGDYQRKGRFEMSESGFHVGHVQPEWLDSGGDGCYSLILNNDNGLSSDRGDTFSYAGAGGRRRGQNRTAQQSFDQSWDSSVNASLRTSFRNQKPVRVIRGPKLAGQFGTAQSGGGYRYDGLYRVSRAEMARTGPKQLRTCMFTLERCRDSSAAVPTVCQV